MSSEYADGERPVPAAAPRPQVKCVVWDLDNTLWHGILLEDGDAIAPREDIAEAVRALDARGILQSVASRNDEEAALAALEKAGLREFFLAPQIGWHAKSGSVRRIADALNIGLDTFLFLDDDPFERAEVQSAHPAVRVAEATDGPTLLSRPDLAPAAVTADGARRRLMYQAEQRRSAAERDFTGAPEEFLATLGMRLTVRRAGPGDLARAEELTVRTHQLNATGYTYDHDELDAFRTSPEHTLLVAELTDRFGAYGTIGLVLLENGPDTWTLKLLLASCRVMSRGIGGILLHHLIERSRAQGVRLVGEFVPTARNRPMLVAYRFAGFTVVSEPDSEGSGLLLLEHRGDTVPAVPGHLDLVSEL
ncbi:HAD-IIIC family phosphatase [Streptomyces sp. NPDC059063]|uniref:HAD-IIIC family phosphatase n=1 Tax=unclassified Streptomyces TaxID=2593676 RepID=UPI0036ABE33F